MCSILIAANGRKNSTSALINCYDICKKKFEERSGQNLLNLQANGDGVGELTAWKFDQHEARMDLAEMILDGIHLSLLRRKIFGNLAVVSQCSRYLVER